MRKIIEIDGTSAQSRGVCNFAAGPCQLPLEVLQKAQSELLDWQGSGISILETSHRSSKFEALVRTTEAQVRDLLNVPESHAVLFMVGGGKAQFAAAPLNLASRDDELLYLISGTWSKQAAEDARSLGFHRARSLEVVKDGKLCVECPLSMPEDKPKYIYFCSNETVHGIEFCPDFIETFVTDPSIPLVSDMSSNFFTRPITNIARYAVIFATAQKNFGPAGVTIAIVRRDLLSPTQGQAPSVMNYALLDKTGSLMNTPPCFSIYMVNLVLDWLKETFTNMETVDGFSRAKASLLYSVIDDSFIFENTISQGLRSRMNVVFRIIGSDGCPNENWETEFLQLASSRGLIQLKGHRSVGGIRASLYNAINLADIKRLVIAMMDFEESKKAAI